MRLEERQPPDKITATADTTTVAMGVEGIPPPPPELGWLAILGVAVSLVSLIRKR